VAAFPLPKLLDRLERAAPGWRASAMAMVAAKRGDPFRVLVGTLLSLRTRDETTLPALERLMALARDPARLAALPAARIARAIYPVSFYRVKGRRLRELARELLARHGGRVPADMEALLALSGVGRKTANLVLGLGFGVPAICVDTHVHRILNRLGALETRDADDTEHWLRRHLPRNHWLRVNRLLVPFGQVVCTPLSPRCSACPVADACDRVGVMRHR
jgi:endonuclease-3